nr:ribonuclease H-like domain-containing protein [Tanacetum cinerariifolium]
KTVNDNVRLQALIDGKKVVITEASIRHDLQLNDAEGTSCLPNAMIFEELARLSAKTTSWNEFSSIMASAIICLANNQKFNFSKYIFDNLKKNLEAGVPFYMFPRFVQVFVNHQIGDMSHNTVGDLLTADEDTPILDAPSPSQPQRKHKPRRKEKKERKEPEVSPTELPTKNPVPTTSNDPLLVWLFNIDGLSKSMNYAPDSVVTNSNDFASKGASFNACQSSMETGSSQDYILMPIWKDNSLFDSSSQASDGHNKDKHGLFEASESDNQERSNAESSTKTINTTGPVYSPTYVDYPNDPLMPDLEDAGIFDDAYDDRDESVEVDYNNLETMEPKKVTQALDDESWVEAMQEELLQFKLLNVWTLVDLPPRKRAIRTKWVYRNKRD